MKKLLSIITLLSSSVLVADDFYRRSEGPPPNHFVPICGSWLRQTPEVIHPFRSGLGFFAALPSFQPEYSLSIYEDFEYIDIPSNDRDTLEGLFNDRERKKVSNGFFISTKRLNRGFNIVSTEDLIISTKTLEISKELAIALNRVWVKSLLETSYPKKWNSGGLDGTTYIFSARGIALGEFQGTTWSPPLGSIPRDMVDLANKLVELVSSGEPPSDQTVKELIESVEAIEKKIDSQPVE